VSDDEVGGLIGVLLDRLNALLDWRWRRRQQRQYERRDGVADS
jgi:hypothetical protein